jgi:hypothetical protein
VRTLSGKLTYSNVMATVAVFIALGGASYAAIKLPKNSVGAKQLRKGAVTPKKLNAAVRSKLKNQAGSAGPRGEAGPRGPSDGFYAFNNDFAVATKTLTMNVPAGNYMVTASMFAANSETSNDGRVGCRLYSPSDPVHDGQAAVNVVHKSSEASGTYANPSTETALAIGAGGGAIIWTCKNFEGTAVINLYQARISAIMVDSLVG